MVNFYCHFLFITSMLPKPFKILISNELNMQWRLKVLMEKNSPESLSFRKIHIRRFYIITTFSFCDMHICFLVFVICQKVAYFFRKMQTWQQNNSRILQIKNAKCSGYCLIWTGVYRIFLDLHCCTFKILSTWTFTWWRLP